MRRTASLLFTTALALSAVAATSDDGAETADTETTEVDTDHPCYDDATGELSYPEQQVWFHQGDSKLGNAGVAPWDTAAPETSVTGGAGAGAVSGSDVIFNIGGQAGPGATFAGTFDGCIDTMLFDVYSFDPTNRTGTSGSLQPSNHTFSLRVTIDGQEVFSDAPLEADTELANEGMGPNVNRFALDLGDLLEQLAGFDLLTLDGTHEIQVEMRAWYVNTNAVNMYVWDTTEVPSGITFNGEVTEEYAAVN